MSVSVVQGGLQQIAG